MENHKDGKKTMGSKQADKLVYIQLIDKLCEGLTKDLGMPKEDVMKSKLYCYGLLSGIVNTLFSPHIPRHVTDHKLNRMIGHILAGIVDAHGDMGTGLEVEVVTPKPGEPCPSCGEIHSEETRH